MANIFENKDRRVIPNWRSFAITAKLGELNAIEEKKNTKTEAFNIGSHVLDWSNNKTVPFAAELLSAALVSGTSAYRNEVEDAAKFILDNEVNTTIAQINFAKAVLSNSKSETKSDFLLKVSADNLSEVVDINSVNIKISDLKKNIKAYPYNSVYYVEISRFYSILGKRDKAIRNMKIALHLSKDNRFVLRSAVRLFAHYGDVEFAHDLLRKNIGTNHDPWLTAAEISMATLRERTSRFIKRGIELINSKNIAPLNFTELASSIGTVELINGSVKKSRILFNQSLIKPNDNSLAQIEWALRKDRHIGLNTFAINSEKNYEALAYHLLNENKVKEAIDNAARWFIDMPFSKRPVMFASNIASTVLKDHSKAITFLNAGLISHPNDPQIINNMAYALILQGKLEEAKSYLDNVKNIDIENKSTEICLMATNGLLYFRMGLYDKGRHFYLKAIEDTKVYKYQFLNWIAILNYAREEINISSEYVEDIMLAVSKIPTKSAPIEVSCMIREVKEEYQKYNNR